MAAPLIIGNREKFTERRLRAWELRKSGASYRAIARELGYSYDTAHKDVQHVFRTLIERTTESAEQARKIDTERLDTMLLALASKIRDGNVAAIGQAIQILARRAKMYGYDAPEKVEMSGSMEVVQVFQQAQLSLAKKLADLPIIDITPALAALSTGGESGNGRH